MIDPKSLPVSDPKKRIMAFAIDDFIISLFFFVIFYEQFQALGTSVEFQSGRDFQSSVTMVNRFVLDHIAAFFALKVLYHTVLVWQSGMTLGKYFMKIRVVSLQGRNTPSFMTALWRALLRIPAEAFFYLGFIMAFFTPRVQAFHDKFMNCVVIDA